MEKSDKMKLCCTIADEIVYVLDKKGVLPFEVIRDYHDDMTVFTEEAQDLFNAIYDVLNNYLDDI